MRLSSDTLSSSRRKSAPYLRPYIEASELHGGGFPSLLWASRETQLARFQAFSRLLDFTGQSVLDVGCGRADLLDYFHTQGQVPGDYVGIEAVPALADAAASTGATILRKDFIAEPACMFTGSDIVVFCGSLNTAGDEDFFATLKRAFDATARHLLFNFLSSTHLAGAEHLYWRKPNEIDRWCRNALSATPKRLEDYMFGDATFLLTRAH